MTNLIRKNLINQLIPWLMWGLGAATFFIEYIIRVAPVAISPSLMKTFNASYLDISAFSAYFLYAYVFMQIPVGLLVDRFGARACLCLSTLLCAFATLLFSWTHNLYIAEASRILLGLGAAFALVGTLKLALVWFKPQFFSILVGITQSLGMIGGAAGVCIMGRLADLEAWQLSFQFFGVILGIISLLIALFVRNTPIIKKIKSTSENFRAATKIPVEPTLPVTDAIMIILKSRQTWIISIYAGLLYMPTAVFAELWGSVYLMTTQNLSGTLANDGVSTIFVGWAIGAPCCGILANRFGRRLTMIYSAFSSLLLMSAILYLPPMPIPLLYSLLFAFGVCNSGMVSAYTSIAEINPKSVAGVALGFGNGMSVLIGAFCQQAVGALMDWIHGKNNNEIDFSAYEMKMVMIIIIISVSAAWLLSFFTKETFRHE